MLYLYDLSNVAAPISRFSIPILEAYTVKKIHDLSDLFWPSWSAPGYSCYSYGRHWSHSYTHSIHYKTENSCLQLKTKTKLIGKKERYSPNYAEFNTSMLRGRKTFCYQQTPQLSRIECQTQAFAFTPMLSLNCVCKSQFQKSANIE